MKNQNTVLINQVDNELGSSHIAPPMRDFLQCHSMELAAVVATIAWSNYSPEFFGLEQLEAHDLKRFRKQLSALAPLDARFGAHSSGVDSERLEDGWAVSAVFDDVSLLSRHALRLAEAYLLAQTRTDNESAITIVRQLPTLCHDAEAYLITWRRAVRLSLLGQVLTEAGDDL